MSKRKVLDRRTLPKRLPLAGTILTFLALDYWNAPQWLFGVAITFYVFIWGATIYGMCTEKEINVIEELDKNKKEIN